MEFLTLCLYAAAVWVAWRRPEREALAWTLCLTATAVMVVMYAIASWNSFLPWVFY